MSSILGFFFQGAFVMLRTGWSEFFDQPDKFLGNFEGQNRRVYPGEEKSFDFPQKKACNVMSPFKFSGQEGPVILATYIAPCIP